MEIKAGDTVMLVMMGQEFTGTAEETGDPDIFHIELEHGSIDLHREHLTRIS